MPFIDDKVQEVVTEQIVKYLSTTELSFIELKKLILNKAPIPEIHSNLVTLFNETKKVKQIEVQKALEDQAYKNQIKEDKQQENKDLEDEEKDNTLNRNLLQSLKQIRTQINDYETIVQAQTRKLEKLFENEPSIQLKINKKKNNGSSINSYLSSIQKIQQSIQDYQVKIQRLAVKKNNLTKQLSEIETHNSERKQRHEKRKQRADARTGYRSSGERIEDTLSIKNKTLLSKNIQDQHNALELKYSEFIQNSEHINFPFFLDELHKYINKSKTKLSVQDVEATNTLLKFMLQHLAFELQSTNMEESINKKEHFIRSQIQKLEQLKTKIKSLQNSNPHLTTANKQLKKHNSELASSQERYTNLQQRMSTAAIFLAALTLVFSIPLILAVSGTIPFFIAPILLYALSSLLPCLLLLATASVGIAALVYTYKTRSNNASIKTNEQTITSNINRMEHNEQDLKTIKKNIIPQLESQIEKENSAKEHMINSLKNSRDSAIQAFKRAQEIEPKIYSSSRTLLLNNTKSPKNPDKRDESLTDKESFIAGMV